MTRRDDFTALRFEHGQRGLLVELASVELSVANRHVQNNRDRHGKFGRKLGNEHLQRLRPAGRDADDDDVEGVGRGGAAARPAASRRRRRPTGRARAAALTFSIRSSPISRSRSVASAVGFWTKSTAPGVERRQHQLARLAGDADDDDRNRAARHLLADEPDAVELGHDQVARDDVGVAAPPPSPAPRGRHAPRRRLR